jgi:DNA-binding protein H-NS
MLSHGNTVRSLAQQLEEAKRQLSAQKVMTGESAQQRDELQAAAAAARKELAEAKQSYAKKIEQLEKEMLALNEMVGLLRAKSEADDKAVAELAALVDAVSGTALEGSQSGEHVSVPMGAIMAGS